MPGAVKLISVRSINKVPEHQLMRLDTERSRATPEGVTLSLRVSGPPPRFLAWMVDFAIIMVLQVVLVILTSSLNRFGEGLYYIIFFIVWWFYPVFFEVFRGGVSPGKSVLGLQVLHDDGTPVGWTASLMRNLLHFADFLPLFFGFGLLSMFLNADFKRLGDLVAGTVVVYRDRDVIGRQVARETPISPPLLLNREEQRAVIDFGERLPTWNPARAEELANIVTPLTGAQGEAGTRRLLGIANWLLGRQGGDR